MSFPRYPEYKDSGVAWLGEVPSHWTICGTGHRLQSPPCYGVLVPDFDPDGVPMLKIMDLANGTPDRSALATISERLSDEFQRTIVRRGDVVLSVVGTIGTALVIPEALDGINLSRALARLLPNVDLLPQWLVWVFSSDNFTQFVDLVCVGSAQRVLNMDDLRSFRAPFPPIEEQTAIASFLDRETAKIDALVAEQEKRQAVISHAVTKGLDPNVPMKDSGVEWLGEVPGHWEVCALRRVIAAIEQGLSPECYAREAEEQEWGVLKAGCLNGGNFRPSENKALPPELPPEEAYEVRVGDVLMSRASGSPELVGSTALVKATRERLMLSDKIFRLKLKEFVNAAFFVAALNSRPLRIQIENALSGGNGMANTLPQSSLLTFAMAVPPLAEQATITVFLEQETAKLDTLTAEARSAITLLQERRTALISAAVTGQIDVRGLAGSANAPDSVAASAYPASA